MFVTSTIEKEHAGARTTHFVFNIPNGYVVLTPRVEESGCVTFRVGGWFLICNLGEIGVVHIHSLVQVV